MWEWQEACSVDKSVNVDVPEGKGILPRCPQAPLLAKLVLYPVLADFTRAFPDADTEVWIDDIGYTIVGTDPQWVAQRAMLAYRRVAATIEREGLEKSGFLTRDKEVEKWINQLTKKESEPKVNRVMKDLGIDATAGRCRRIPTVRKRLKKGKARHTKLLRLRVGSRACKIRVIKGSIHAVVAYGAEGLGVPPRKMRAFRLPLAQTIGWQKGGSMDVIYCQNEKVEDPMTTTVIRHLLAVQRLVKQWPTEELGSLEKAWKEAWAKLEGSIHLWKVAYGPIQAAICYLIQMGWSAPTIWNWTKEEDSS